MMLSPVHCVLMSNVLIHLKDRAKTAPLHSALPANPRHWLGADSKAAHVGVCTGRSQVTCHHGYAPQATSAAHSVHAHDLDLLLLQQCLWLFWRRITSSVFLFHMDSGLTVDPTCPRVSPPHPHLLFASFFSLNQLLPTSAKLVKKIKLHVYLGKKKTCSHYLNVQNH